MHLWIKAAKVNRLSSYSGYRPLMWKPQQAYLTDVVAAERKTVQIHTTETYAGTDTEGRTTLNDRHCFVFKY
jgi:hypothetical protein